MNDEAYRKRVSADLEKWIASGFIAPEHQAAIVATLPAVSERPAASILAWAGSVLAGLAVIAFMAANWDGIPRLLRLALVLGIFWGALYGAIWCEQRGKTKSRQAALLFAVLVFAAGLGLVGQMYNLAGDPADTLLLAGFAGLLLGAAGRSAPAVGAGMLFAGVWYVTLAFQNDGKLGGEDIIAILMLGCAAWLASFLRSRLVLHLTIFGVYVLAAALLAKTLHAMHLDSETWGRAAALIFAGFWVAIAFWGRERLRNSKPGGATIYAYGAWFALTAYPFAGLDFDGPLDPERILHRLVWLGLSLTAMALGNKDGQRGVLAAGVVSLVIAIGVIMADLQLSLFVAAGVFALAAAAALGLAWKMPRNKTAHKKASS